MNQIQANIQEQSTQWIRAAGLEIESVQNLSEFTQIVSSFFRGSRWIFRGETALHESPAAPSIFRGDPELTRNSHPDKAITDQEIEEVEKCRADFPQGSDRYLAAFIPSMHRYDVNWLPFARHFGYKTRLLDVTLNPLVALFFACSDVEAEGDSYVYAIQSGSCRPLNARNPEQQSRNDYPPIPISYLDLYDVDVQFCGEELDRLPYLFEPSIPQERLQAQAGRFLFWRDPGCNLPLQTQVVPIRIDGELRESLIGQLTAFGVTRDILFPNEDA